MCNQERRQVIWCSYLRNAVLDPGNIDQLQIMDAGVFQTGNQCLGSIQGSQHIHTSLDGGPADDKSILRMPHTLKRRVNDQIDLMPQDQIHQIRRLSFDLINTAGIDPILFESLPCASGGIDSIILICFIKP